MNTVSLATRPVGQPFGKTVGMALLSWKSPKTVRASIQTYLDNDLFSLFDDAVICFQEIDEEDRTLAEECGIRCVGTQKNTGIQGGFRFAWESLDTDYIIIMENDCPMCVDLEEARKQLQESLELLTTGTLDLMRLRSRFRPGEQSRTSSMYSRFWSIKEKDPRWIDAEPLDESPAWKKNLRRLFRPSKATKWIGRSIYVERYPEQKHPEYIQRAKNDIFIVDSAVLPWTNQTTLISRDFLGQLLDYADTHPSSRTVNGFQDFEKPLNCAYWKNAHFKIGAHLGIFTHQRLDR